MIKLKGLVALGVLTVFPGVVSAAGFDVERYWASGENFSVLYAEQPAQTGETFSVIHDAAAQMVTFNFTYNHFGTTTNGSCQVGINSVDEGRPVGHVYLQAAEMADNIALIKQFRVASWGGICYELANVQYREDIALVEFNCDYGYTYWGQSVYVVGNTPRLGNWNPANAVKLDADNYPHWSKSLVVETNREIEWKCLKRDELNPSAGLVWEPGANNFVVSGAFDDTYGSF